MFPGENGMATKVQEGHGKGVAMQYFKRCVIVDADVISQLGDLTGPSTCCILSATLPTVRFHQNISYLVYYRHTLWSKLLSCFQDGMSLCFI